MIPRGLAGLVLIWVAAGTVSVAADLPLGKPGTVATYELEADPQARPEYEKSQRLTVVSAELALGPRERGCQWLGLKWTRLSGQSYQAWLLLDHWPAPGRWPSVARYLWLEPDWPQPVEFVNEATGEAQLPRLSLWHYGFPQLTGQKPSGGWPIGRLEERIQLQGWNFKRVKVEQRTAKLPPVAVKLPVNPDLIIGHITRSTDVDGKPPWELPGGKYRYRKTTAEDQWKHYEAGFNLFQAMPRPEWLTRSSAYDNDVFWYLDDWPAQLYRSNYWGRGIYVDEPAIHNRELNYRAELAGKLTPGEAVQALQKRLKASLWQRVGNYSKVWINEFIDKQFGRGNLQIVENDYPVWEAIWTTAWYQLAVEDGVAGVVDEDASLSSLVESYNMAFGTQIPATVQNACAIRVAVLRGAARNFGKRWGVAFYSPAEARLKASSIQYLYDKGASYFWVWTGWVGITDNSGLPYPYQRYYASLARQAYARTPRRDMNALRKAAKVCVVIPNGYTFAPYPLQYLKYLHLERTSEGGATYREVLTNAAREVERCLRQGLEFDVAVDEPAFRPVGYEELVYCQEDGQVRVVRPGRPGETLAAGREVARPDLGPLPTVAITVVSRPQTAPGKLALKAEAAAGTGELAGEAEPLISWEVYGPGQDVVMLSGPEVTVDVTRGGVYRVRVAVADTFGRPAVAWQEVTIEEGRQEWGALPPQWAIHTDPRKVGEAEGWSKPEFADAQWMKIPVPTWWENTPVGAFDGIAWYRVHFAVPVEMKGRKLYVEFGAVDEEAWVYLNGRLIGEHTTKSTGQSVHAIWDKPFTFELPAEAVRFGQDNVLAVRVADSSAMGGIFKPVRLLADR